MQVKVSQMRGRTRRGLDGIAGLRMRRARKRIRTIDAEHGALEDVSLFFVRKFHLKKEMSMERVARSIFAETREAAYSGHVEKRRRPIASMRTSCAVHATLKVAAQSPPRAARRPPWRRGQRVTGLVGHPSGWEKAKS